MQTLDKVDIESKRVILRTDLNLPVENGKPQKTVRFERYLKTIQKLSGQGAKTVIVAHQGRPARQDFLSLKEHSKILSTSLGQDVEFVPSFFGPELGETVAGMQDGDVAVLENIRFLSEELQNASPERHSNDFFIEKISQYFDIYVDDAFSAAHRSHGSMVGFTEKLDSYAGPIMEKELQSCSKIRQEFSNGVLVLGGEKPSDLIGIVEEMVNSVDKILLGGVPGELALLAQGKDLGEKREWIEERGLDSKKSELLNLIKQHKEKFMLPEDAITPSGNHPISEIEGGMTWDIGKKTRKKYVKEIQSADSVMMKGPMGAFEEHPEGTKEVLDSIAKNDGFTVLGGGHTSSLVHRFGYDLDEFSHVSIAGGAFVRFMSGEKLPAVEALE